MNFALVDVVVVTVAALCAGVAFTVWRFRARTPHLDATNAQLKRFFEGKTCAICKQPIPPVHKMGSKPGLLDPETHETHSWDEIPDVDLSKALETSLPVCFACEVAESFRQRFPELVVDSDRSLPDAHPPDRVRASS